MNNSLKKKGNNSKIHSMKIWGIQIIYNNRISKELKKILGGKQNCILYIFGVLVIKFRKY